MAQKELELVAKALREFDGYPESARQMLLQGLPHAVAPVAVEAMRHELQGHFSSIVRDVLEDAQRRAVEKQASAEQGVRVAEAEARAMEAALGEAAKAEEATRADSEAKAATLQAAQGAIKDAEQEHEEALLAERTVKEAADKLRKAQADATSAGLLLRLLNGNAEGIEAIATSGDLCHRLMNGNYTGEKDRAAAAEAVVDHLRSIKADEVLAIAAAPALAARPEGRGAFDKVTVDAVDEVLKQNAAKIDARLTELAPAEVQARNEALGFWAILDVARDKEAKDARAHAEAQAAFEVAMGEHNQVKEKVCTTQEAQRAAHSQQALANSAVQEYVGSLAALERLLAAVAEPPVGAADVKMADATGSKVQVGTKQAEIATANPFGVPTPMIA